MVKDTKIHKSIKTKCEKEYLSLYKMRKGDRTGGRERKPLCFSLKEWRDSPFKREIGREREREESLNVSQLRERERDRQTEKKASTYGTEILPN